MGPRSRRPIRKNYYRHSDARRRAVILRRLRLGLKAFAGIALLLLFSFAFIFGYDFLTQCDYFRAQQVSVTGTCRLSEAQVLQQAQIHPGMNILSLNLSMVRKRLLALAWVADAQVSRELPSKLHVHIQEHQPLAILDMGRRFIINTDGQIFKEVGANDPGHLPRVSGLEFSDINVKGEDRSLPFNAVMNVLLRGQKPGSVLPVGLIREIRVDRDIGLTLYAPDLGPLKINAIKIGFDNYDSKYAGLKNILNYLEKRPQLAQIEAIDLNNIHRIVVQPAVAIDASANDQKEV